MKYEMLKGDTIDHNGRTLFRIRRISNGLLGGYIEKESNLSQLGDCFVFDNAEVSGDARVSGYARVYNNARVSGNAFVYGNAMILGNSQVYGNAKVYGNTSLKNHDEINNTSQYFNIIGFEYPITVTHSSINIGCRSYTLDQLDTVFDDAEYDNKEDIPEIKSMIEIALNKIHRSFSWK